MCTETKIKKSIRFHHLFFIGSLCDLTSWLCNYVASIYWVIEEVLPCFHWFQTEFHFELGDWKSHYKLHTCLFSQTIELLLSQSTLCSQTETNDIAGWSESVSYSKFTSFTMRKWWWWWWWLFWKWKNDVSQMCAASGLCPSNTTL